jgi:hypothetical protein
MDSTPRLHEAETAIDFFSPEGTQPFSPEGTLRLAVEGASVSAPEGRQPLAVGDERSEEPTESIKKKRALTRAAAREGRGNAMRQTARAAAPPGLGFLINSFRGFLAALVTHVQMLPPLRG